MRKPRCLHDDADAEKTSLQPPWRPGREVGAPVPRNEEMPLSEKDHSTAAEDASMASSETTQKIGNHSTASFYSVSSLQSRAMRRDEENDDDMTRRVRPASLKQLVENEDDTFPVATDDAERDAKIKATAFPQQVRWTDANEARHEGKNLGVNGGVDETLPFMTEDVGYGVGSMEATKQYARGHPLLCKIRQTTAWLRRNHQNNMKRQRLQLATCRKTPPATT